MWAGSRDSGNSWARSAPRCAASPASLNLHSLPRRRPGRARGWAATGLPLLTSAVGPTVEKENSNCTKKHLDSVPGAGPGGSTPARGPWVSQTGNTGPALQPSLGTLDSACPGSPLSSWPLFVALLSPPLPGGPWLPGLDPY